MKDEMAGRTAPRLWSHVTPRRYISLAVRHNQIDVALRDLAERQHGVIARMQATQVGASWEQLRNRVRSGTWSELSARVLRVSGSVADLGQGCMAAVLDVGPSAVVSRTTAAALWRLPGFELGPVHVTRSVRASSRASRLATVHESRFLPDHHVGRVDGIPVTTVARTVFDMAGCLHPLRVERVLDNALSHSMVGLETLRAVAIELLQHGRTGSALMRVLLEERGAGYIPPASGLEAALYAVLVAAGLALPDRQVDLGAEGWVGRVDYYYRPWRVVIEVDSDRHHTSKLDREADARRDAALTAAGFRVVRITEDQVRERPLEVVALVRAALADAAARGACSAGF